jgi:hypothetical protein
MRLALGFVRSPTGVGDRTTEAQMSDKIAGAPAGARVMAAALLVTNLAQPSEAGATLALPDTKTETAITIRPLAAEMSTKVSVAPVDVDQCGLFTFTSGTDTDTIQVDC